MTDFEHVFHPPSVALLPTLLMLHGTGGNEHDLLPLASRILPGAGVLSPRGKVLEGAMPRFFRRLAEGVFDLEDLAYRTAELADFIIAASDLYKFDAHSIVAVGFSNGANIAGSLMLLRPGVLRGAVLFRAMVPVVPDPLPDLAGTRALVSNGRTDPLVTVAETERLVNLLRESGADVDLVLHQAGHQLIPADVEAAKDWIKSLGP